MAINFTSRRWRWFLFVLASLVLVFTLFRVNKLVQKVRREEQKKVEIWAEAIGRKADLVEHTGHFFRHMQREERRRVEMFVEAHKMLMTQPLDADVDFYFRFISENKTIPVIITDEFNNIQFSQNVEIPAEMKVLTGNLYQHFTRNDPITYRVYGMVFKLYYAESKVYADLRAALKGLTESFLREVSENSVSVPVLVTDKNRTTVYASGNLNEVKILDTDYLNLTLRKMESENTPISIMLPGHRPALIFYENSSVVEALQYYPLIYVLVIALFAFLGYVLFHTVHRSEQNLIWVGMSKETAHQLGTPISSLMAWIEYMKLIEQDDEMVKEVQKDVSRLETIAQRFSKIGSVPELQEEDLAEVIQRSIGYLKLRTSRNIQYRIIIPRDKRFIIPMNAYLMEWVFENTCKNAVDAMEGEGIFTVEVSEDAKHINIDLSDTGKGIPKKLYKKIFTPGFTTKKRGWGLGLSLAKRIITNYHKGDIFVKKSEIGKGTTLRIALHKNLRSQHVKDMLRRMGL